MAARPLVLAALLIALSTVAIVRTSRSPEGYSVRALTELLRQPARPGPGASGPLPSTLWEGLLSSPMAEHTPAGPRLALGRVWAAPTIASLAAERAGELLALPAEGPEGPTGEPLWRMILEGPSGTPGAPGERRTLALYGCRHSTDPDAGPVVEDSYHARRALARALEGHARAAGVALELRGASEPVRGGVNFEVQLLGEEHAILVTFDGVPGRWYRARRAFRPIAPHADEARQNLVSALRTLAAADPRYAGLEIVGAESAVQGGVDVRVETVDGRFAFLATRAGARLRGSLVTGSSPGAQ